MIENTKKVLDLVTLEDKRQQKNIQLIASENFVSEDVLKVQGSILTNKYAEGYPAKRYYGGCEIIDQIENLAIENAQKMFQTDYHVNVQPHSGTSANMGVYLSILNPGDKILGMDLNHGGHLTHGHKLSISGILYDIAAYGVDEQTMSIDYDEVERIALEQKPKLIIAGASAYPQEIDFKKFKAIADKCGAYLMADIAHIAGLIVAGIHNSPFGYADFITSTTHKTLRGPRGGIAFCKPEFKNILNRAIFPGIQGGPLEHVIGAKAVAFGEALTPEFKTYQEQIVKNAQAFADEFKKLKYEIVGGTTANHLILINTVSSIGLTGDIVEKILDEHDITLNKNTVPFDKNSPISPSGIRVGTPAMTTRGYNEEDFRKTAQKIDKILRSELEKRENN